MARLLRRLAVAVGLLLLGILAFAMLAGPVGRCLGPLGVTPVQCASMGGGFPSDWTGIPFVALSVLAAVLVISPLAREHRTPAVIGAVVAGAALGIGYLLLRAQTMEGFTSSGAWISIPRPVDLHAFLGAVVLGGMGGMLIGRLLARLRRPSAGPG